MNPYSTPQFKLGPSQNPKKSWMDSITNSLGGGIDFSAMTPKPKTPVDINKAYASGGLTPGPTAPQPAPKPASAPNAYGYASNGTGGYTYTPPQSSAKQSYIQAVASPQASYTPQQTPSSQQTGGLPAGVSTAPPTPYAPRDSARKRYEDAMSSYLASLQPSNDLQASRQRLADMQLLDEKQQSDALYAPGDTLAGANVERANIARNNAFSIGGEANRLNALTGQYEGNVNAAKIRAELEKDLYEGDLEEEKFQREQNKPFELGEGQARYEYDPTTGGYKQVASVPKTYAPTRGIGAGGANGGLVEAVMQNPSLFQTLTPSAKTSIIPALVQAGFQVPAQLSAGQEDDLATMDTVKSMAQGILDIGAQNSGFPGVGGLGYGSIAGTISKNLGIGSQVGRDLRSQIANVTGTIAKLRGGTSFTPNEQALLNQYVPTINDSDPEIEQKLINLVSFINQKKQALLQNQNVPLSQGQSSIITAPDGQQIELID